MNTSKEEFCLDNSRRSHFAKCPYRYWLTYEKGIQPKQGSTAIRYGSVFHAGMEGFYSHIKDHGWTKDGEALKQAVFFMGETWEKESEDRNFYEDYRSLDNCITSLVHYINHFAADEQMLEVLNTERAFKILVEPGIYFTGKLDLEMLLSGQKWINEFKTTGRSISYVAGMQHRDSQFNGYTWAMKKLDTVMPEGILITYHMLTAYKSKKTGEYGDAKIEFERLPQFFTEQDHIDWKDEFLWTAEQIMNCKLKNNWPRRYDSCHLYGKCPYLFLCEQRRPRDELNLAGMYNIRTPWNVLETVPENKIVEV
ncbi:MAG: PD-(D/E)XK nuclease family protein [Anaerovoracaceae bacterium]